MTPSATVLPGRSRDAVPVAIVTGTASGIGRAIASVLERDGLAVVGVDLQPSPVGAVQVVGDLRDERTIGEAVSAARSLGSLGAVVNAAGIQVLAPLADTSDAQWDATIDTNVGAVFRMCRAAIPHLVPGSAIVNVSSVHAERSMTAMAAYAASKGALSALTRQMALDLADRQIRVLGVAPGAVDTPMSAGPEVEQTFSSQPGAVGRLMAADEIAEVVAFLVSSRASALNGTVLVADAGLTASLLGPHG